MTKKDILAQAKADDVSFVNLQFTDIHGMVKAVTIPISKLEDAIDVNVWFDGSSISGFTRIMESDMYLKLDLDTYAVVPWSRDSGAVTARIICDVYTPDNKPFEGDPRYILKKVIKEAEAMGFSYNTGPELEFFLFKKDEKGKINVLPQDTAGYFDQSTDLAGEIRKDMSYALQEFGIEVEALHHEVAIGQHEIDFKYGNALTTADNATTFKYTLKAIAGLYDLHATFMPKPVTGINGSGMHVHQSFFKDGKNAFFDDKDPYKLSKLAYHFIAGQLHHAKAISAITNPIVNSYKRLVVGYEAPVYICWAQMNRSALIRIPRYTKGRENAVRCELRSPDPSCNPYLAFAVMLKAGLDGIKNEMKISKPVEENMFEYNEEQVAMKEIATLPADLKAALKHLKEDTVLREVLGEHTFNVYYEAKKAEWYEYKAQVTKWEIDKYLEIY
jgi:glutamine synthetase